METTARYATAIEGGEGDAVVRIAIYARLSRDPGGLSANMQVVECLEEARRYAQDHGLCVDIVAIFEENDISASKYSKKLRFRSVDSKIG